MSDKFNDLIKRMSGDFYVGVVGSVRSGKSSFINKFFELKVLPYITDKFLYDKIVDELPQSQSGKGIMTVEPKFVPSTSVNVNIGGDLNMNVRMVDSVGYIIPSSVGYEIDGEARMVKTPWFNEPIEFKEAALLGTKKVMESHSNLGILLTSDGTIGDFKREEYEAVEEKIIPELQALDKAFVVVINSKEPNGDNAVRLKKDLEDKYNVGVCAIDVLNMTNEDLDNIFYLALNEFKLNDLSLKLPDYINVIGDDISIKEGISNALNEVNSRFTRFKDVEKIKNYLIDTSLFKNVEIDLVDASVGSASINLELSDDILDSIIHEILGEEINTKAGFISALYEGQKAKKAYKNIEAAINEAKQTGYGVSIPTLEEMKLLPPNLVKQSGRYGVKLSAIAPSIHMIKVDVESTFTPIIGSEAQSQSLIENLVNNDSNPDEVWNKEIFGRTLSEIVNDGIKNKIYQFPELNKVKIKKILDKLVNNESNSVIAIIL